MCVKKFIAVYGAVDRLVFICILCHVFFALNTHVRTTVLGGGFGKNVLHDFQHFSYAYEDQRGFAC